MPDCAQIPSPNPRVKALLVESSSLGTVLARLGSWRLVDTADGRAGLPFLCDMSGRKRAADEPVRGTRSPDAGEVRHAAGSRRGLPLVPRGQVERRSWDILTRRWPDVPPAFLPFLLAEHGTRLLRPLRDDRTVPDRPHHPRRGSPQAYGARAGRAVRGRRTAPDVGRARRQVPSTLLGAYGLSPRRTAPRPSRSAPEPPQSCRPATRISSARRPDPGILPPRGGR